MTDPTPDALLDAFLASLRSDWQGYAGSWREDFDLASLAALSGDARARALDALLAVSADDSRVPRALAQIADPRAEAALRARCEPPYPDAVRARAAVCLHARGEAGPVLATCADLLASSPSRDARITLAIAFARGAPEELLPGLRRCLEVDEEAVRHHAVSALVGTLGLARGGRLDRLAQRLGFASASVREDALARYEQLRADLRAGASVEAWTEPDPPAGPALEAFLVTLRASPDAPFADDGLDALSGVDRERAELYLLRRAERGEARALPALARLGVTWRG